MKLWGARADSAQAALQRYFWDPSVHTFYSSTESAGADSNYWWQAHALDALVMGLARTKDSSYSRSIALMNQALLNQYPDLRRPYYDDMEWMALALLRVYEVTGKRIYSNEARLLWRTIKLGWSDEPGGGGIRWNIRGLYKNVPANAPACILACKLYEDFGEKSDLHWAKRIFSWVEKNLVIHSTGVILDGISFRNEVGRPSHGSYSYNYGTFIGACVHLFGITREKTYLDDAVREANVAEKIFAGGRNGILRSEGTGDGGLFNGIFIYYLARLGLQPELDVASRKEFSSFILRNAESLWDHARRPGTALFNDNWRSQPIGRINLSVQVSGVTLIESCLVAQN